MSTPKDEKDVPPPSGPSDVNQSEIEEDEELEEGEEELMTELEIQLESQLRDSIRNFELVRAKLGVERERHARLLAEVETALAGPSATIDVERQQRDFPRVEAVLPDEKATIKAVREMVAELIDLRHTHEADTTGKQQREKREEAHETEITQLRRQLKDAKKALREAEKAARAAEEGELKKEFSLSRDDPSGSHHNFEEHHNGLFNVEVLSDADRGVVLQLRHDLHEKEVENDILRRHLAKAEKALSQHQQHHHHKNHHYQQPTFSSQLHDVASSGGGSRPSSSRTEPASATATEEAKHHHHHANGTTKKGGKAASPAKGGKQGGRTKSPSVSPARAGSHDTFSETYFRRRHVNATEKEYFPTRKAF